MLGEEILSVLFGKIAAKKNIFASQIKTAFRAFRAYGRDQGRCRLLFEC